MILKFSCSAVAVSLVGGKDDLPVALASQSITLFIHIMLYFSWAKTLVRHHEAVKAIETSRSRWRGLNAIQQTDPACWKPVVQEIEAAYLLTHGKVLHKDQHDTPPGSADHDPTDVAATGGGREKPTQAPPSVSTNGPGSPRTP